MLGEEVDDAGDKGCLGARDEEVDVVVFGEGDEAGKVGVLDGCHVADFGAERCGAAVSWDDVDVRDAWGLEEFPSDGVFAAAIADEEDAELICHVLSSLVEQLGGRRS